MNGSGLQKSKRIVWSPHDGKRLFLVGGNDIRLYEWSPQRDDEGELNGEDPVRLVAVNNDVTHMKCFDWSPSAELSDLVAVGYTTGRTVLTRIKDFHFVNRSTSSSMTASLSRQASSSSLYQSGSSTANPKLLAAGMDKVRSESGLLVWDTEASMRASLGGSNLRSPSTESLFGGGAEVSHTGMVNTSEGIKNTLSFTTVLDPEAAIDLRKNIATAPSDFNTKGTTAGQRFSSNVIQNRPIAQFGASEGASSGAWFYHSSPQLVAGMGLKWIRGLDIRASSSTATLVIPTKAVLGIVADPFHAHRFASFAEDNIVRIWDARNVTEPALAFNAEFRNTIGHISWSPVRSGCLAAIGRDSPVLKVWDIQESSRTDHVSSTLPKTFIGKSNITATGQPSHQLSAGQDGVSVPMMDAGVDPGTGKSSLGKDASSGPTTMAGTSGVNSAFGYAEQTPLAPQPQQPEDGNTVPILWKTRHVQPTSLSLQSFAWLPFAVSDDFSHHVVTTSYTKEHKFTITRLPVTYKATYSPEGDLAITGGRSITVISPQLCVETLHNPNANIYITSPTMEMVPPLGRHVARFLNAEADVSVAASNRNVLRTDSSELQEVWDWIARIGRTLEADRMSIDGVDYTGQGIHSVVQDMLAARAFNRRFFESNRLASQVSPDSPGDPMLSFPTYSNPHRQLGLVMCGWSFHSTQPSEGDETLEQILKRLEDANEYEKAAGWALFHSSSLSRALESLNRAGDERLKLVATAIAGYSSVPRSAPGADMWANLCRSLSAELENPYLRAIFALIASNADWSIVLQEQGLSLRDRVGIALRFLDDDQLMKYISKLTAEMLALGDISALLLTGYTPTGVDLLQHYIDQTGDIQTATLLMSSGTTGRFQDSRVDEWAETYRSLLDRWQLYHVRARFDIGRQRFLAGFAANIPHPSTTYNANVPPQIYVRCNFCNQAVVNGLSNPNSATKKQPGQNLTGPSSGVAAAATTAAHQTAGNPPGSLVVGPSKQKVQVYDHGMN
ncbi:hypothetical protein PhCBS80983_g05836 [Powellomyces hirtus]|uniref:MIOS-like alpha-solenoid domain-containing protein n=1 Tax=Powellomyces hirtus TaxID=109895 RepID=A0A507DT40_9FUNG|nr:hypothetical protein PhCBS80983_g05836 [Powellomyces hirtus]